MGLRFVSYTLSSKDVPRKWSLVAFLPGCNLRCKHCHNWRLVVGEKGYIFEREVIQEASQNPIIDTVVLSGGEPTVHSPDRLRAFIERIKNRNPDVKVRIDTNGYNPEVMKKLVDIVDGFAVDIKAPISNVELYEFTTGTSKIDMGRIRESIGVADQLPLTIYRTPRYPWLLQEDIEEIREFTDDLSSPWFLNEFFEVPSCPFNT
ncbi:pyruvate formate lyase activating enzyme [Hydrogenivirga caldilitoris]|uniref:Pyruvate formate lyase activating enzyme n=1 Tax=Hydrogenivirga caldilitoris TaxID=246264 RepID=A0A497XPE2_9AQUI|nr:radical SAM protein [Hydrogenivirga caldilitoris]RLJ70827.1 pyruvate formate lyase activating enzyme [Hydrogenivirga caldilitoris]